MHGEKKIQLKKVIFLTIIFLAMATWAWAVVPLSADPQAKQGTFVVTQYKLTFTQVVTTGTPQVITRTSTPVPAGTDAVKLLDELSIGIPSGTWKVTAIAVWGGWGDSPASAPFTFTAPDKLPPSNLGIPITP